MTITIPAPYSTKDDLLIEEAGLVLGAAFDKEKFVREAATEIKAKLGFLYRLPLTLNEALKDDDGNPISAFPENEIDLLKMVNNNLASGRLYMTLRASADGDRLHVYGMQLVTEAENLLNMIANGMIDLSALKRGVGSTDVELGANGPKIVNHDDVSLVDAFEQKVYRGQSWTQVYPGGS